MVVGFSVRFLEISKAAPAPMPRSDSGGSGRVPLKNRISRILLPKFIRKRIFSFMFNSIKHDRMRPEPGVPIRELQPQHISNLEMLANRRMLLERMPTGSICAEVGVDRGDFSRQILDVVKPKKLYLIDLWGDSRYNDDVMNEVKAKLSTEIESGQVEICRGYSHEVLAGFEDDSLDWAYIDTDHTYQTTKLELDVCASKVKSGGVIAGHDYVMGTWNVWVRYGVIEAVNEFCVEQGWEMIHRTTEMKTAPSFALKKML